jgi:predicted transposase/invertase (TIGR01784 family)
LSVKLDEIEKGDRSPPPMASDSLFYEIFQESPQVFFELIGMVQPFANLYSMDSQEVKQTRFQIDNVFKPHHRRSDLPIYFVEVMDYKPKQGKYFYLEMITEIFLYLNDYRPRNNWRVVVIYTQRSYDPGLPDYLNEYEQGDRLQRIHLNQMPQDWQAQSPKTAAIQLIIAKKKEAPKLARQLIERVNTEATGVVRDEVLELIETIFTYKYPDQTRQEIIKMLGLSDVKETRVYKDAKIEEKMAVVSRSLAIGLSVEQIAQIADLPIEEVRQLIQKTEN